MQLISPQVLSLTLYWFTLTYHLLEELRAMTILLLDSYDSFTFNLRSLIEEATGQHVITIHNDSLNQESLSRYIPLFDAVVIGPGPGHPSNPLDVGVIPSLFKESIPILGICLGFQSLCLAEGCDVMRSSEIKHGQVYKITHTSSSIFKNIDQQFDAVRYHSLCVPRLSKSLEKLAYTTEPDGTEVIMATRHLEKPWVGVQFHPESICSKNGVTLVKQFIEIAQEFNKTRKLVKDDQLLGELVSSIKISPLITSSSSPSKIYELRKKQITNSRTSIEICDILHQQNKEFVLLNSAASPGQWSIIGIISDSTLKITHSTEDPHQISLIQNGITESKPITNIWTFISDYMSQYLVQNESGLPFIGGFMGIFSYEEGQHIHIDKLPRLTNTNIPDTKLVFIENCILVNNKDHTSFITSLNDDTFISDMEPLVNATSTRTVHSEPIIPTTYISKPCESNYTTLFNKCQEYLRSGDSYELCVTVPTKIGIPSTIDPWTMYKTLTSQNPSPYSAYFNFDDCVLLSSSPERFISWDETFCQLRPIKGTVKKTHDMTRAKATEILNTPKELGENLMIVDLIRHDLYELLNKVEVTKLMSVEEYKTVYQLVSVIEGYFEGTPYRGIDILSRALPPGSMTGAPKKRSVEILQMLEGTRRGLYSGICGYWSIEDNADWSVIIRSLFHYKDDVENDKDTNLWRIGAGGAITVLSDVQGEWQEMLTKLDSALRIFETSS